MTYVLSGKYKLGRLLGQGSFGKVSLATDMRGDIVVVKSVTMSMDPHNLQVVHRELSILKWLTDIFRGNPLFNKLLDFSFVTNGGDPPTFFTMYLVMEYIDGVDLHTFNRLEMQKMPRPVRYRLIAEFSRQILSGLDQMHRIGIAHRDIKLDNIMVCKGHSYPHVVFIDYGLSCVDNQEFFDNFKIHPSHVQDCTSRLAGTPNYLAPQLVDGTSLNFTDLQAADIWAFGIVLYYLVYNRYPFNPSSIDDTPDFHERIRLIINHEITLVLPYSTPFDGLIKTILVEIDRRPSARQLLAMMPKTVDPTSPIPPSPPIVPRTRRKVVGS